MSAKKLTLSPLCFKMSALAQAPPSLPVRTHHKFRNIRSFLHQKVRTSASKDPPLSAMDNPPECGRLLWTFAYSKLSLFTHYIVSMIKVVSDASTLQFMRDLNSISLSSQTKRFKNLIFTTFLT